MLGESIVDGDDGEVEDALPGHGVEADDASGGFLGAADDAFEAVAALGVENGDQIAAVVHGDLGLVVNGGHDVLVVGVVVLALDGIGLDIEVAGQRGGDVVLCGEGVGGAEGDVSTAVAEGDHEVGGLGGDVETGSDAEALEGLILDEILADALEDRHGLIGPFDAFASLVGQGEIFDVVRSGDGSSGHKF